MGERSGQEKGFVGETRAEVEVWWEDPDGAWRSELVDGYEDRYGTQFDLYECPGGYRVFVYGEGGYYLHPFEVGCDDGELEYGLYTAEEVAKEYPLLGHTLGHSRVRDLG